MALDDLQVSPEFRPVPRPYLFAGVFTLFVTFAATGYVALEAATIGMVTQDSAPLCARVDQRVEVVSQIHDPKMVFIGGSSVRAGISAGMVGEALAVPAVNFGLQAALGPRLILHEARKVLRPGDVAVLVLEYSQFDEDRWNEVSGNFLLSCGESYFSSLSVFEKIEVLASADPERIISLLGEEEGNSSDEVLDGMDGTTRFGDRPLTAEEFPPVSDQTRRRLSLYQPLDVEVNFDAEGSRSIGEFVSWAQADGIRVVATWPNTIWFDQYLSSSAFSKIEEFYRSLGVPIIGDYRLGMYPVEMFYDTQYHLGPDGIRRRTADLIEILRENVNLIIPSVARS